MSAMTLEQFNLWHADAIGDLQPYDCYLQGARDAQPAQAVERWQPIATAPKDETVVLTYSRRTGIDPARFISGVWAEPTRNAICEPSHWMPLPISPAPDKECQP